MKHAYLGGPRNAARLTTSMSGFGRSLNFLAVPIWISCLVLPQIAFTDWFVRQELSATFIQYQMLGAATFLLIVAFANWNDFIKSPLLTGKGNIGVAFVLFSILLVGSCFLSVDPLTSFAYAVATILVFAASDAWWRQPSKLARSSLLVTAAIIYAFLIFMVMRHGIPEGRSVGGVVPNRFGKMALVGLALAYFSSKQSIRALATIMSIGGILLVNSRGSLLALVVFLLTFYVLSLWHRHKRILLITSTLALTILLAYMALALVFSKALLQPLLDALAIFDDQRGFGSGFTGRASEWSVGIDNILANPFGYGFKGDKGGGFLEVESAHNGYLNLMLDVGVFGFVAFLTYIAQVFRQKWLYIRKTRAKSPQNIDAMNSQVVALSFATSTLMLWMLEPLYLNIGAEYSVVFILLLCARPWHERESSR